MHPVFVLPGLLLVAASDLDQRPLATQRHSVAAFSAEIRTCAPGLVFLPLADPKSDAGLEPGEAAVACEIDGLIDLIRTVVEPGGWDSEGWRLDRLDAGHLIVTAPAEVHAKIGELLATLERDLLPSERLEIRLLAGGIAAANGALWVDRATADQRLVTTPPLHVARLPLHDLAPSGTITGTSTDYVAGWDMEIAQGAYAVVPRTQSWLAGLRIAARATRVEAGALVDLLVTASGAVAPTETISPDTQAVLNLKPALITRSTSGRIDLPRVGFASFGGTLLLNEGKVLWLPVTLTSAYGPFEATLEVRCELGTSKVAATIDPIAIDGGGPLRLTVRRPPAAVMALIEAAMPTPVAEVGDWFGGRFTRDRTGTVLFGACDAGDTLFELARAAAGADLEENPSCQLAPFGGWQLRTLLPTAASERVNKAFTATAPADAGFTLRGRVRRNGVVQSEFALPLLVDHVATLWTGVQTPLLRGWEHEVANDVTAAVPRIETVVDGAALRFQLLRGARGDLLLDVRGAIQLLDEAAKLVELGDASRQSVHLVNLHADTIDDRVALPAKGGRVTLGGDLTLELELAQN